MSDALKGKTVVVTAGNRGMGEVIALRYAASGANIVIIAPKDLTAKISANTNSVSEKIITAGGNALTLDIDVTDVNAIEEAMDAIISRFHGIDILINNLSTLNLKSTSDVSSVEFDYVITTNMRATFFISKVCFPYLKNAENPHIINIAPPLDMNCAKEACQHHLLFSISKYGMSLCTLGMAEEFKSHGIAVNSLWPQTPIATQTLQNNFQSEVYRRSRWSEIMADAAYLISSKPAKAFTGNFCIDEEILHANGMNDFTQYAVDPSAELIKDIFLPGADYATLKALNISLPQQYKMLSAAEKDIYGYKKIQPNQIKLIPASLEDYPVIQNMGRFYAYDMSEYMGGEPGWEMPENGLYECIDFKKYWHTDSAFPFLIRYKNELAGFVIVDKKGSDDDIDYNMAQLFIIRKFKRKRVGQFAAHYCFSKFKGVWEVMVMPGNNGAYQFWKSIISKFTNNYTEYKRSVKHFNNNVKNIFRFNSFEK